MRARSREPWVLTPRGEKVAAVLHGIVIAGGTAAFFIGAILLSVFYGG
jgi:hypothetical protein